MAASATEPWFWQGWRARARLSCCETRPTPRRRKGRPSTSARERGLLISNLRARNSWLRPPTKAVCTCGNWAPRFAWSTIGPSLPRRSPRSPGRTPTSLFWWATTRAASRHSFECDSRTTIPSPSSCARTSTQSRRAPWWIWCLRFGTRVSSRSAAGAA